MADYTVSVLFKLVDQMSTGLKNIRNQLSGTGDVLKKLGRDMSLKVTAPLMLVGGLALHASNEFNRGMANVSTLLDGTTKEAIAKTKLLKESVSVMAEEMGKSSNDLAGGLYEVVSAFGDSAENMEQLRIAARGAVAGLSTTKESLDLLSAVGKAYNDTSSKTLEKISDLSFMTVKLGKTNFPELSSAMQQVASMAATVNMPMEELFGSFATLTGVTGSASEVSAQLVGVLKGILSPSEDLQKLFADTRVPYRSAAAMAKAVGMWKTLRFIWKAVGSDAEKFAQIFGGRVQAMQAVFAGMGPLADVLKDKTTQMASALGMTAEAFKRQTEGVNKAGFQWEQLKVQVVNLAEAFGDVLTPQVVEIGTVLVGWLKEIVRWFVHLDDGTKRWIIGMGLMLAAIGPLLVVASILVAVFEALSIPALAGAAAIMGLVVVGGLLLSQWKNVVNYFKTIGPILYDFFIQPLIDAFHWLQELFQKLQEIEEGIRSGKYTIWKLFGKVGGWLAEKISLPEVTTSEMAGVAPGVGAVPLGGPVPLAAPGIMRHQVEGGRSQTDVNIKVSSDDRSRATIEGVRTKGDTAVDVRSESYIGALPF